MLCARTSQGHARYGAVGGGGHGGRGGGGGGGWLKEFLSTKRNKQTLIFRFLYSKTNTKAHTGYTCSHVIINYTYIWSAKTCCYKIPANAAEMQSQPLLMFFSETSVTHTVCGVFVNSFCFTQWL